MSDASERREFFGRREVLPTARRLLRAAVAGHDVRGAPEPAEIRDVEIDGPAGPLPARLYVPQEAQGVGPLIVFFHGGGFVIGDLAIYEGLMRRLAAATGWRVLAVEYRLAPEAPYPAQHEDALAAARWALAHAEALGLDPDRLVLAGDSAGGHMAARASITLNGERPGAVWLQILLYPLVHVDDALWADSRLRNGRAIGRGVVAYMRGKLGDPSLCPSLLNEPLERSPVTLMVAGGLDPVRPDVDLLADALARAGVPVVYETFELLTHGAFNIAHLAPAARRALRRIGALARAAQDLSAAAPVD